MCGIVGLWNVSNERPLETVSTMLDAMRHRGPDGRGTLEYIGGAAGMVRLALVDLSDRGQQPLWSNDRRVAVLFNGEIYNFRTERDRLEKAGYRFRTTTDTEVVLNLYLERGLEFYERMRGMYAVAIFDWRQSAAGGLPVMVLARGPLGIKHLYIAHPNGDPQQVIFSSEIRAMLASGLVRAEISTEALAGYLARGFVLQPDTMIAGVRMLAPGTLERYAPGEPMLRKRFWRMPPYAPRKETLDEAGDRLRAVLNESVALHAMADAPIGAFLSGGVDSTGIVALMRKHISDLRTYTVKFPDLAGEDEVKEAIAAAQVYDCHHTVVEVSAREVRDVLPRFAGDLDQPSADGFNTWLISRAAARDVKGVLSGVGGDEWFAGYPVTRRMARYGSTASGQAQMAAGHVANLFVPWLPQGRLRERVENLATRRSALATWLQGHTVYHESLARQMAGLPCNDGLQDAKFAAILNQDCDDWTKESPVGLSCLLDTRVYMINQLLRDSDATSMAHSLELRVPFVDLALVAFSRSCDDEFKLRSDGGSSNRYYGSGSKRVLIHALRDLLPLSISNRQKKGFALPFDLWMRGELAPLVEDTCGTEAVARRGLVDPQIVAAIRKNARAGVPGITYPGLWTLMIFELWCRAVVDKYRQPAVADYVIGVK
ncbi:MAG: asparagine synthase (glutamine-hydrolyzing) [Planctomycetia bacterium]|nr:asparagine synthase (glutamine-hydrolyzing) [Planctomycetia bacterium]